MIQRLNYSFALLSLIALSGCGKPIVDPNLAPYIDQFQVDAKRRGLEVDRFSGNLRFVETLEIDHPENTAAVCIEQPFRDSIQVSRGRWAEFSEVEKRAILYHEFGHCVLKRDHLNGLIPLSVTEENGRGFVRLVSFPRSIMNSGETFSPSLTYEPFWNAYLDELFSGKAITPETLTTAELTVQGPEVYDSYLNEWKTAFNATLDRMVEIGKTYGQEIQPYHIREELFPAMIGSLLNNPEYSDPNSEHSLEVHLYASLSNHFCPKKDFEKKFETIGDRRVALSLRSTYESSKLSDFVAHYTAHREEYLNELFTGRFEKRSPEGVSNYCDSAKD